MGHGRPPPALSPPGTSPAPTWPGPMANCSNLTAHYKIAATPSPSSWPSPCARRNGSGSRSSNQAATPATRGFATIRDSLEAGLGDGWHQPDVFDRVRNSGRHRGCQPQLLPSTTRRRRHRCGRRSERARPRRGSCQAERRRAQDPGLSAQPGRQPQRGQVRRLPGLPLAAVAARQQTRAGDGVARGVRHGRPAAGPAPDREGLVAIPAGRFFNWRFGLRRMVPPQVTKARWRNPLDRCVQGGGIVHLWLHPHNLITGPGTGAVLSDVLADVARLRDQGKIEVLTQRDYCGPRPRQAA